VRRHAATGEENASSPAPLPSNDFSRISHVYDQSRTLPATELTELYRQLMDAGVLREADRILDVGCGTGQVSLPLVELGFDVTGIDISRDMVARAADKARGTGHARYEVADVQALPFADGTFDVTVGSKIFQHVGNWRLAVDEVLRVTKPDRCFVHINETGAFRHAVRRPFESAADRRGYRERYKLGNRSELVAYFERRAASVAVINALDLKWEFDLTYDQQFTDMANQLHAEFWVIPDHEFREMCSEIRRWVDEQPEGGATAETMRAHLKLELVRRRVDTDV